MSAKRRMYAALLGILIGGCLLAPGMAQTADNPEPHILVLNGSTQPAEIQNVDILIVHEHNVLRPEAGLFNPEKLLIAGSGSLEILCESDAILPESITVSGVCVKIRGALPNTLRSLQIVNGAQLEIIRTDNASIWPVSPQTSVTILGDSVLEVQSAKPFGVSRILQTNARSVDLRFPQDADSIRMVYDETETPVMFTVMESAQESGLHRLTLYGTPLEGASLPYDDLSDFWTPPAPQDE